MTFKEWVRKWHISPGMNDDPKKTEFYSGFDGEVGDGWVPILDRLATDLVALGWDRKVYQIKEKFGTLRFYAGDNTTDEMGERIGEAESESAITCEECGAPGELRQGGWLKTLCDQHWKERQEIRKNLWEQYQKGKEARKK